MLSIILFAFTLTAGSAFAAVYFRRDFGDTLPLSVLGILLTMYIAGAFGLLKAGVYLILGITTALWLLSAARLIKEKNLKKTLKTCFGAEAVYFLIIYMILLILNMGRVAWHHDEFSHWMDCVKAMSNIDDFAANYAMSGSDFASYPPGMALFQYFFQKLHEIFEGTAAFCEWRPYVAFQLFAFSLFFPMLKRLNYHKILKPVLFAATMLVPLILYPDFFAVVLIDPILGVMSGAAFIYLLTGENRSLPEKTLYLSLLCAALVLMKDAGIVFAVFIAAAFILTEIFGKKPETQTETPKKQAKAPSKLRTILLSILPLLSSLCATGSWKLILNHLKTPISFSAPIRFGEYLRIFFSGGDTTYRQETVDNFKSAFMNTQYYEIHSGIRTSYMIVLLAFFLALAVLTILLIRKSRIRKDQTAGTENDRSQNRKTILLISLLALQTVLYIFFLGAVYISKFSEYEAMILACYERYMRTAYLPVFLVIVWMALLVLQDLPKVWKTVLPLAMSGVLVLLCSFQWLGSFVTRGAVQESLRQREPYRAIQEAMETECQEGETIRCYSEDLSVYDRNVIRFVSRPKKVAEFCILDQIEDDQWIASHLLDRSDWLIINQAGEASKAQFKPYLPADEDLQPRTPYKVGQWGQAPLTH